MKEMVILLEHKKLYFIKYIIIIVTGQATFYTHISTRSTFIPHVSVASSRATCNINASVNMSLMHINSFSSPQRT